MAKAKYQFDDFLALVKADSKDFVVNVHEMLLQKNYKPKLQVTKSTGFQLSYHEPKIKTVAGRILIFFFQDDKLMIRLEGKNHGQYPDVLNDLPERMVNQIDKAVECIKFTDPEKCWKGCIGYAFHIGGTHYQKCITQCFQFTVEAESIPAILELIESELNARVVE